MRVVCRLNRVKGTCRQSRLLNQLDLSVRVSGKPAQDEKMGGNTSFPDFGRTSNACCLGSSLSSSVIFTQRDEKSTVFKTWFGAAVSNGARQRCSFLDQRLFSVTSKEALHHDTATVIKSFKIYQSLLRLFAAALLSPRSKSLTPPSPVDRNHCRHPVLSDIRNVAGQVDRPLLEQLQVF
jgi:hypothetical protein